MTVFDKILLHFLWKKNLLIFKLKGCKIGMNSHIGSPILFRKKKNATVRIGDNFTVIGCSIHYNPVSSVPKSKIVLEGNTKLTIGNDVGISTPTIWIHDYLIIGDNVKIGSDCLIIDSDCHSLDYMERRDGAKDQSGTNSKGITICDDVLIGARCTILKGVSIGKRTIIGAGSVVSKSIPDDCIAAGNPCKIIKRTQIEHE